MSEPKNNKMKDKFGKLKKKFSKRDNRNAVQVDVQWKHDNAAASPEPCGPEMPKPTPNPMPTLTPTPVPNLPVGDNSSEPMPKRPQRPSDAACIKFPHAIVKFPFTAQQSDELNANKHDLVVLLKRVDENWYYACTQDQKHVGFIPANFLDVRIDLAGYGKVAPPALPAARSVVHPTMEESPYKQITESCTYDVPKARAPTPQVTRDAEEAPTHAQISPIPDGCLLLVNQEFVGENSGDLSASIHDVLLWLEPGAKRGQAPPEDWIKCAKLNGVCGEFPGNVVEPLSDEIKIMTYLKEIPQAEATRDYEGAPGQCIPLQKSEVFYLSNEDAAFYYGRSASGKEGKVPKDVCKVTVALQ